MFAFVAPRLKNRKIQYSETVRGAYPASSALEKRQNNPMIGLSTNLY